MIKALIISSLALNTGLLLGRLSGMVREATVALTFGASAEADVVVLMLTVPDLLVNILMGGAFGAVLIPEFTQRGNQARQLLYQSLLFFGLIFVILSIIFYRQSDLLVSLMAPGFLSSQHKLASIGLGWVIWLIPLTVLVGLTTAYLQSQNRFLVASLGTLIINSSIIAGLIGIYFGYGSLQLLAISVILGGLLRLLSQLLPIRPSWQPIKSLIPGLIDKALLVRYLQVVLSGSLLLLLPVIARAMASYEGEGSVALFNYATRLIEFPLAIGVTFLAAVFFPRLARSFADDPTQHRQLISYGVQITLGLAMVAAITLIMLSDHYTRAIFGYGNMQNTGLAIISNLIIIGLASLPLQGLAVFLTTVFNSRKDTRTPMLINAAGLGFFLITGYVGLFGHDLQALMWGVLSAYCLICLLQLLFLKVAKLSWAGILLDHEFLSGMIVALILQGFFVYLLGGTDLPVWLTLLFAVFIAIISILIMALFNKTLRLKLKDRLGTE